MRNRGFWSCASLAFAAIPAAPAAADGPYVDVSAAAIWQDNVTNATPGDGVLGAFTLESSANAGWLKAADFSTLLSWGVGATADICTTYSGLDSVSAVASVGVRHKLGLGPYAPSLYAGAEADAAAFSDSARSSAGGALVARLSQRFDEALQVEVDARGCAYGANSEVYAGSYLSAGATLNWDVSDAWRIKATGGWRDGDVVADYAAVRTPYGWGPADTGAYSYTGARALVRTFGEPFIAYRGVYQTWSYGVGVSPAVGPDTSLTLMYTRSSTAAYDRYVNNVVSAGIVHHF
jgi:hypothetical protein